MDNLFNDNMTLVDIEHRLQTFFLDTGNHHYMLCSIPLTLSDCHYMVKKFKSLTRFQNESGIYEDFSLSIVVMWAFCQKYNLYRENFLELMEHYMDHMPQHCARYYVCLMHSVFDEYDLETFGYETYTIEDLCQIIHKHAEYVS